MIDVRKLLLLLSALGAVLFGTALGTSLLNPVLVETTAREMIRRQVETQVHDKIDALDAKFLSSKAGVLIGKQASEAETARRQLREKVPERVAAVISEMRDLDCECRKEVEAHLREGFELQMATASQAQARLTALIRTKYTETAEKLTREFRIFTGTNALVFALLGIAAIQRRGAGRHLMLPALVLVVASTLTGYLYLFNQDWLHTILFSDYVGFAYLAYVSTVFAFLCDVWFNRARGTTHLLNALGSSVQVLPC